MKKILIATSVIGLATAAQAQSQITLQGTVDAGYTYVKGSLSHSSMLTSGDNATSKLVMRGVEDLGGGMYANFWLESGINLNNGSGFTTTNNNQASGTIGSGGLTFNRRSIVGLGGSWGEVHLGREWSPTYDAFTARYDLFGVGVGIGINYKESINPNQVRVSNAIAYTTPQLLVKGLTLNVQHWSGNSPSGKPTSDDGTGEGMRVNYDNGPWSAVAAYARTKFAAGNALYRDASFYYDPGPWKIALVLNNDQQGALKQRGWNIGGLVRVGNGEIKATYSGLQTVAAGSPTGTKIAVGYVYNFSKRTAAYATYAHVNNRGGSALSIAGSTTAANRPSSGIDIGLRHFF